MALAPWALQATSTPACPAVSCAFTIQPGPDQTICTPGQTLNLGTSVSGPYLNAVWSPATGLSNPNSPNTQATVHQTTTYTLTVSGVGMTNLITNGNFNAGLSGFTSNYAPGTGGPFGLLSFEGTFAVATNANLTHNNFANCNDHTGGGNMLVVNGAGTPNQNVWCQTVNVTPNTGYAFSAWGASVVAASPAILQFSINGTLLGSPFQLPAALCQWTQFFQTWNSGAATTATICIVNQNTQPSGNDFALDDLFFGPLCQETAQVTITVQPANAAWTPPSGLCPYSPPVDLHSLLAPGATPNGTWTINGTPGSFFYPGTLGPGTHVVTYTAGAGPCTQTLTQSIIVNPLPNVLWAPPSGLCVSSPAFPLHNLLLPGAQSGGQWTVNGAPVSVFQPGVWGPGAHTVVYTAGTPPCTNTLAQLIDVAPLPNAAWTPPPVVCQGDPPIVLNSLLNPGATPGGAWTVNGAPAVLFNPTLLPAGAYQVAYAVGPPGCQSSVSGTITIRPRPTATFSLIPSVCITDTTRVTFSGSAGPNAVFHWDFADAVVATGSGRGPYGLLWPSPGFRLLSLLVEDEGCSSLPYARGLRISPQVDTPRVVCNATLTELELVWNRLADGSSVVVYILDGPLGTPTSDTSYLITGLMPGQQIRVRMVAGTESICDEVIILVGCQAQDCDNIAIQTAPVDTVCLPADTLRLQAAVQGASSQGMLRWSGPGIVDSTQGLWMPHDSMAGHSIPVVATYSEALCLHADTLWIPVRQRPIAAFDIAAPVCEDTDTDVVFTGSAGAHAQYFWVLEGDPATTVIGPGSLRLGWPTPGVYTLQLWVDDASCRSDTAIATVQVDTALTPFSITCQSTDTAIFFSWPRIPGAAGYHVQVLPVGAQVVVLPGDTSAQITALMPGDTASITVQAWGTGACSPATAQATCSARICPDLEVLIQPVPPICWDGHTEPVPLIASLNNDTLAGAWHWTGTGIVDTLLGVWQPSADMIGRGAVVEAAYTYLSCVYVDTLYIAVHTTPKGAIVADSAVCQQEELTLQYTGDTLPGAIYHWDFGIANATPGQGAGPHHVRFNQPGVYEFLLVVEANGCRSDTARAAVEVFPRLSPPVIRCEAYTYTSVQFTWSPVAHAAMVETWLPGGQTGIRLSDTSLMVENLVPGEPVQLLLTALSNSPCPAVTALGECSTRTCPNVQMQLAQPPLVCWDGQPDTLQMTLQLQGAPPSGTLTWEGEGILQQGTGLWASQASMVAQTTWLKAVFRDDVCTFADSVAIRVQAVPQGALQYDALICLSEVAGIFFNGLAAPQATYIWRAPGAVLTPGVGPGPHSLHYAEPGLYEVILEVDNLGCFSQPDTARIQVDALLELPTIACSATYSEVVFSWPRISNAAAYSVQPLGGVFGTLTSDTTYTVSALMPGQQVATVWRAHSLNACPDAVLPVSCSTLPCPNVSLEVEAPARICLDSRPDTLQLRLVLNGASAAGSLQWEGEGILDTAAGWWASDLDMAGRSIWVKATYTDDVCVYADSAAIAVFNRPTADFVADTAVCIASGALAQYIGQAGVGAQFHWQFGNATATPGMGAGLQTLSFPSPGAYDIGLTVEANGCTSEPFIRSIQVEDTLRRPEIQCQATYTSLSFSWQPIPGASSYQIELPPGLNAQWTSNTSLRLEGLAPGSPVSITIQAQSQHACPNTENTLTCQTTACPTVSLQWMAPPVICAGDACRVQWQAAAPAGTAFDVSFTDGVQTWMLSGLRDGDDWSFVPTASTVLQVLSVRNADLPFCPVAAPAALAVSVEHALHAGVPLPTLSVCAQSDTLIALHNLLQGADAGGQWSVVAGSPPLAPGSLQTAEGHFTPGQNPAGLYQFQYALPAGTACPADSAVVSVQLLPLPPANAGPNRVLTCLNPVISIGGSSLQAGLRYFWTTVDGHLLDDDLPLVEVDQPGRYRLEVTDLATGCRAWDEAEVRSEIAVLQPEIISESISCYGADDAFIQVLQVQGGQPPLAYALNGGTFGAQGAFYRLAPGEYRLRIRDAAGCEAERSFRFEQPPLLQARLDAPGILSEPLVVRLGDSLRLELQLNIPIEEIAAVRWTPDICRACLQASLIPLRTETYMATVTSARGCTASARLTVLVDRRPAVFVPSAFSPNQDGYNDVLMVLAGAQVRHIRSFRIFDRWGENVFEAYNFPPNDPAYGWNGMHKGQPVKPAVFVYWLEAETIDGETHLFKGDVTVLR